MVLLRALGRVLGIGLGLLMVAPLLTLGAAALVDRGPAGTVRVTLFPLALTLLDPFVWACTVNSLLVAAAVALGARVLGVPLARVVARWRFWGRGPLGWLAVAPVVLPPVGGALGLRLLARPDGLSPWSRADVPLYEFWNWGIGGAWLALAWVGLATGMPLVALTVAGALDRVNPDWEEAARAAGATRRQVWKTLLWPVLRGETARAVALVFGLTLLEPGAPLVLNLRRTLAFQLVEAATGAGPPARAAALALLGAALAVAVHLAAGWIGTRRRLPRGSPVDPRPRRADWRQAPGLAAFLAAWIVAAWFPFLALAGAVLGPAPAATFRVVTGDLIRPDLRAAGAASLGLGLAVATLALVLAGAVAWRRPRRRIAGWLPVVIPPLALAVGLLLVPPVLDAVAERLATGGPGAMLAGPLRDVAGWIDPVRGPAAALVLAETAVRWPLLARAVAATRGRYRPGWVEAAEVLGASRPRAWWDVVCPRVVVPLAAAWLLTAALAATDVAAAVVLAPTSRFLPVGPAVLVLADAAAGARPAAVLALLAALANLAAFLLTARALAALLGGRERR